MSPVATKLSGGAGVGESTGVGESVAVGLAVAGAAELRVADCVAGALPGVTAQPASPRAAVTLTSRKRKPSDSEDGALDDTLRAAPKLPNVFMVMSSLWLCC